MRWIRRLGWVLAPAVILTLAVASGAKAHGRWGYLPDHRGYGGVNADHYEVRACDTEADGWGVRTHYEWVVNGQWTARTVSDTNGSVAGCGIHNTPYPVYHFNVCVGANGADWTCTGWIRA